MSHEDQYQLKRLRKEEGKPNNNQNKKSKTIAQMTVAEFMAETSNNMAKAARGQEEPTLPMLPKENARTNNRDHPLLNRNKQKS